MPDITTPFVDPANTSIYNQYTIRTDRRDALQGHLKALGIGNSVYYPLPLHLQPCFSYLGYREGQFPESERAAKEVLSLPVYPELTTAQLDEVKKYRAEGETLHKAGKHQESVDTLAKAMTILGVK